MINKIFSRKGAFITLKENIKISLIINILVVIMTIVALVIAFTGFNFIKEYELGNGNVFESDYIFYDTFFKEFEGIDFLNEFIHKEELTKLLNDVYELFSS